MSALKYVMMILVLLVILADFGVNVSSLVAGFGIITAIFGLAFQDLIKDFIAGVAIIVEDQFSVGDVVEIDDFKGTVIDIGLKTTEIRDKTGKVKIIANHNIDGLINCSRPE
ncbi:mechanosensitive ion channel [Candidatus Saccharibacteria bacterium]|nr:mechanosensitive ion channel [Candidatus Saccharibacteria bacterium]